MNVAIIGCGFIGQKRAKNLSSANLVVCVDIIREKAEMIAQHYTNCIVSTDWRSVIKHTDIDIVIISTIHAALAEIALYAIQAGKHVLIEKPAGKSTAEIKLLIAAAKQHKVIVRVGLNHRYHPAFQKARECIDQNILGELMFLRARYGHGGRLGYNKEWRANQILSGGGELIDQGMHLIDLARWLLGDFTNIQGFAHTYYWDMPVDDNGFMLLRTKKNKMAFLHASCTEWKNLFSFEIYGRQAKIDIQGLGGSYGVERLALYKMLPNMGPPETQIWEYPMEDNSWKIEFNEFLQDIELRREPAAGLKDAYAALSIVKKIYKMSNIMIPV